MKKSNSMPPPRPVAPPRLGGGVISFKSLEEEGEDELTSVTGKFDQTVSDEREKVARNVEKERSLSKSPDLRSSQSSEVSLERSGSFKGQNSLGKLIDLKDKIQSEIQRKKDEFLSDKREPKDKKEVKDQGKSEPKDKNEKKEKELETIIKEKSAPLEYAPLVQPGRVFVTKESLEDSGEFENPVEDGKDDTDYFESKSDYEDELVIRNGSEELEIDDEYFNPTGDDFSDLPGVVPMLRQRKRLQKFRKIKPVVPQLPVSMSKLSKSLPEVNEPAEEKDKKPLKKEPKDVEKWAEPKSLINLHGTEIPVRKLALGVIFVLCYIIIPLPTYLNGMILGGALTSFGWMIYLWVTEPARKRDAVPDDPPLEELPPLPQPEIKEPKGEDCCYKGWMNELVDEYNPEKYSINQTHSVYVHLEGTVLRLRRPKIGIPKRAMWDEPSANPNFIHQRHFDIEGSKVLLLPPGLVKKRLWSKKYPICIALAKEGKKQVKPEVSKNGNGSESAGRMSSSSSVDSVRGFEMVSEQSCDMSTLFFFARTCREKEQWYRRFLAATSGTPLKNHIREVKRILENASMGHKRSASTDSLKHRRQGSSDSLSSVSTIASTADEPRDDLEHFVVYMSRLIPKANDSLPSSPVHGAVSAKDKDLKLSDKKMQSVTTGGGAKGIICEPALLPLNAFLGRLFWDFLGDEYWAEKVKEKLQKKLSKIHIPYFIEELQISDINLGSEVPVIRRANRPYMDENGFWVDADITYSGKFRMTIETKVNLMKLKVKSAAKARSQKEEIQKSAITDSDEEDSAESSTDEEEDVTKEGEDGAGQSTGKKLMKIIDKIAASKYFQSATELKYVKKAMHEVSNTRLILTVEVQKLSGVLAVNIPPPPTDRLWYGFRGNPQLWLVAKPKVGEREVTMNYITEWIEKKLAVEFQHVLVLPNMDDLVIPILMAGPEVDAATADIPHSDSGPL